MQQCFQIKDFNSMFSTMYRNFINFFKSFNVYDPDVVIILNQRSDPTDLSFREEEQKGWFWSFFQTKNEPHKDETITQVSPLIDPNSFKKD